MNRSLALLLEGLWVTAYIAVGGLIFAAIVGILVGLSASSPRRWLRYPARCHIEIFRGTSALVQMFWFFYAMPMLLGISISPTIAGIVVLGLNISAYLAEIVRGSLQAVPRGQQEAAVALGLSPLQCLWRVTLPQAIPSMLPPWGNLVIELTKGSALVYFLTLEDIMYQGGILRSEAPDKALGIYLLAAVLYGLLCLVLITPVKILERGSVQRICGQILLHLGRPLGAAVQAWTRSPLSWRWTAAAVVGIGVLVAEVLSGTLVGSLQHVHSSMARQWDHAFAMSILPELTGHALRTTIYCTALGGALAIGLGLIWAGLRTIPIFGLLSFYALEAIRTTPLLVQLFVVYYGILPVFGVQINPIIVGIITIGIHYSTYTAEVYRSGIAAVPTGQWEAARALGLNPMHTFFRIIVPQAVPRVVPALGNYVVAMLKETPLLSAITVIELLGMAREIGSDHFRYTEAYTIVGILFLAISLFAAALIRLTERLLPVRHA
ncbi:MAG: ectoine/hydroxyectoine ABC transporter permease subunit EhuD [Planctomycetota bacterium]|nr:MAG: ectoine/hydroxyectoine ABC transporter permease subunit EhuD [Planctomycetota bacterium]